MASPGSRRNLHLRAGVFSRQENPTAPHPRTRHTLPATMVTIPENEPQDPPVESTAPIPTHYVACWHPFDPVDNDANCPASLFHPRWCPACIIRREGKINELYDSILSNTMSEPLNIDSAWRLMFFRGVWAGRSRMQTSNIALPVPEEPDDKVPNSQVFEQTNFDGILSRLSAETVSAFNARRLQQFKSNLERAFKIGWIGGMKQQKEVELAALDILEPHERKQSLEDTLVFELKTKDFPGCS